MDPFTLINTLLPIVANVVTLIRHKDGSLSVLQILDETDAKFNENLKKSAEWQAEIKARMAKPA